MGDKSRTTSDDSTASCQTSARGLPGDGHELASLRLVGRSSPHNCGDLLPLSALKPGHGPHGPGKSEGRL